ncbi:MAG: hypothetical protein IKM64_06175 [Clostridia bacterium]|nr:hypothetical protein [Clostridia bacterium]
MKRTFVLFLIMMLLCTGIAAAEDTQLRGYIKGQGYKFVQFGTYPYDRKGNVEPVLWRVLELQDERMLLLSEYVIDMQQVIFESDKKIIEDHSYRRITDYVESDLYLWMNTVALDTLLGDSVMRNALIEEPGGGKFFIMTDEQFMNPAYGFPPAKMGEHPARTASPTPYAKSRGVYEHSNGKSPYWVNFVKHETDYKLQIVGYDGHMSMGAYTRTNIGLRPSVRLDMSMLEVVSGAGTRKDPFILEYTGAADTADVSGEEVE